MAKKVLLRDWNNDEVLPITRGELVLDSSGNEAFRSNEFLATTSQPGLLSAEDKFKIDNIEGIGDVANDKVKQINTTTSDVYRLLFSETADDETRTEGARKSAKLTFNPSTGVLQTSGLIGNIDGTYVNKLTGYSKATLISDITSEDTLISALGKVELRAEVAYNLIQGAYDSDGTIENLAEILKVLEGISDTETIQAIVGKYLPLSGGDIKGATSITGRFKLLKGSILEFVKTDGNSVMLRGNPSSNELQFYNGTTWNDVIHTGNIGSQNVNYANSAGDSALFNGKTSGSYYQSKLNEIPSTGDTATLVTGGWYNGTAKGEINPLPTAYASYIVFSKSYYAPQLCVKHNATRAWLRSVVNASTEVTVHDWHELAFLDSNVASATKLQTARTIWGQSFDGSGNVSGVLSDVTQVTFDANKTYGIFRGDWYSSALTRDDLAFYAPRGVFSGNILIGTQIDSGYKLDVNGTFNATTIYKNGQTLDKYYLPLSGGTITGTLSVNSDYNFAITNNATGDWSGVRFRIKGTNKGFLGISSIGNPIYIPSDQSAINILLHSGNYSSYALPLSGGTIKNGNAESPLRVDSNASQTYLTIANNSNGKSAFGWIGTQGTFIYSFASNKYLGIKDDGTPHYQGYTLYHSGNLTKVSQLTNDSGFITTTSLNNYVTLDSAQTISGVKTFSGGNVSIKLNSTGNEVGVQFLLNGTAKGWVGHTNTTGTYIYNYPSRKYIGVKDDGTPYYYNGGFKTLLHTGNAPYVQRLYARNDFEYYVILLCKYGTGLTTDGHRASGKIYSEGSGVGRYVAADVDIWVADWNSGYDSKLRFDTYGTQEMDLVTCTYGGTKYLAIRITGSQAKTVYFEGTSLKMLFTPIQYYNNSTGAVSNSEIYNSIAPITVSQPYSNGIKYALVSEIPTVTNYYWADQLITNSAKNNTTPTFGSVVSTGLITANSGIQIGSTSDIGWYFYNSRICAGHRVAIGVNTGSLLVSSAWADDSKVPTNGIYSKGNIITPANVQALNLNLHGDWETDFGINLNEGGDTKYGFSLLYGNSDLFKLVTRNNGTASTVLTVGRGSTQVDFKGVVTVANRLYSNEWIQFSNNTGLYWPNHPNTGIEMHIRPNTYSSYGGFAMYGKRGGYSGILLGTSNTNLCFMDDGNNSGLYVESIGKWIIYSLRSGNQIGIGTSSCTANYGITLGSSTHLKGNLLINGENYCYTLTTNSSSNWVYLTKLLTGSSASGKSYEAGIGWHNTGGNGNGALTLVPHAQDSSPWGGNVGLYITSSVLKFNGTSISLDGHTHSYLPLTGGVITTTLSTSLPTYSNSPLKFDCTYNNNDANNARYRPWFAGEDVVNSYGYGVTVSAGIYRDPGFSSGGFYIGCGWDGNASTVMWKFSRNGALYGSAFYESSDQTLKTNIQSILNSDNMPIIKEFDWKSDGTHSYGLIAQELEEQGYSELVSDSGSHKTVNYSAALSLIVGKLQVKIKELEKEIENLKKSKND